MIDNLWFTIVKWAKFDELVSGRRGYYQHMLSSLMVSAHCTGVQYFQNPIEDFQVEASSFYFDSMTPLWNNKYVKRFTVYVCPR